MPMSCTAYSLWSRIMEVNVKQGYARSDIGRNECMLTGRFGQKGYDWWWGQQDEKY